MQEESKIKKILNKIKYFFTTLLITIIGIIKKLFGIEKKQTTKTISNNQQNQNIKDKKIDLKETNNSLPDTINSKTNPEDKPSDTTNDIILELPKKKLDNIKNYSPIKKENIYTEEYIEELIDKELEEIYKDKNFKVKESSKDIKEKIKEIKEKIVPKIITTIENNNLNQEELKKEVKKEVKKIIEEKPLFTPSKEQKPYKEVYFIAYPKKPLIKPKNVPTVSSKPLTNIDSLTKINQTIINAPSTMVQNTPEIPKPSIKEEVKNAAIATSIAAVATTLDIISPTDKKEQQHYHTNQTIQDEPPIELPILKEVKAELEESQQEIKEISDLEKKQEEIAEKIEQIEQEIPEKDKQTIEKKEEIKSLIRDTELAAIAQTTNAVIDDSKKELKKEEFEDRDYNRIENQINHMLEDITNTYLRYDNKLSPSQKEKLKKEEDKLRQTKEYIKEQKSKDINYEQSILQEDIRETEIIGLQEELKKMNIEFKETVSEDLLRKMDKLENMTREQVANADKRILMKRLNKASLLLEMTSILAFPFVRNKYFFYFTIGLIIDNHFNFINAFWKRKVNRYEPADLSQIKKGQDALNGALDITYKNIVELDYLEQEALSRYPELAYDQSFINKITNLRIKLNNQYNKLMKKNKVMEKYYLKTKHQKKILKKAS